LVADLQLRIDTEAAAEHMLADQPSTAEVSVNDILK